MNRIYIILLLVVVCACSSGEKTVLENIEQILVEVHNASLDASSFIEKIEIIPLETNDSSLIANLKKVMYDKEMDVYAIYSRHQIVSTFSGNGDFIGSSKKMKGRGPQEYYMAVDIKFNSYLQGIDFLNPYGTVYTYSLDFKFLTKRKVNSKIVVNSLMALSPNNYIFTYPSLWTDQEVLFANLETQEMNNASYSGTISSRNTMDKECFYKEGDKLYFVPTGINYYFYQIDAEKMKLTPIIYLDFGSSEIKEKDLPGRASGKRSGSDEDISRYSEEIGERYLFLRKSDYIIPLVKFFNEDYVYVFFTKNSRNASSFIFDRKREKGFLLKVGKPFNMQSCFAIVDNILLAICKPDEVYGYVDANLMSLEERHKMEQLKEDDNPVILKYYLKK